MIYRVISGQKVIVGSTLGSELFTPLSSFSRGYVSVGAEKEYIYRNGPMRSSPPALADVVPSTAVAGPRPMQQGAVMMVYGLCKEKVNADRLFNIFCLYGNVVRVRIYFFNVGFFVRTVCKLLSLIILCR